MRVLQHAVRPVEEAGGGTVSDDKTASEDAEWVKAYADWNERIYGEHAERMDGLAIYRETKTLSEWARWVVLRLRWLLK